MIWFIIYAPSNILYLIHPNTIHTSMPILIFEAIDRRWLAAVIMLVFSLPTWCAWWLDLDRSHSILNTEYSILAHTYLTLSPCSHKYTQSNHLLIRVGVAPTLHILYSLIVPIFAQWCTVAIPALRTLVATMYVGGIKMTANVALIMTWALYDAPLAFLVAVVEYFVCLVKE